jgi:PAS domain S-box-containing protein
LKAGFGIPVLVGKEPVAVLEFFCEKALKPDYQLLEVMVHIGAQLGRVFERMQAKEMLYKAYDELETRVRKRTEDLAKANADLQAEINERTRAEAALSHLAAIVESSADAIIGTTLEGTILSWNAGAERIYGYSAIEVKGRSMSILVTPEMSHQEPEILDKIARGEKVHQYETVQMTKEGQKIQVSLTLSPINDVGGHVIGVSTIARDITERKQAEAQLTASLKEKEVLLKEIHHRVKNNLQIISSLLNLQSHYIEDPRALEMFKESQNRVKSMALIHEKLYQSKELSKIEFNEYVRNLLSMVFRSHSHASKNIKLDIHVEPVFLSVDTAVPVSLILNEMVSNSLKHAFVRRKSGLVTIHFAKQPSGRFLLAVRDDGVGLPKNFTLESTSSLGLRLVKILTDQLGGDLSFQSNEGTEFKVNFGEV